MKTIESIPLLRETVHLWRMAGETVAFVPTMGNLHAGHLCLVEEARQYADRVVVSIFVNPTQFSAGEDFAAYPRTPGDDAEKLREAGTDLLFMPRTEEVYAKGDITFVEVPGISDDLCGKFRPGHFRGVATVVCKLFNMVQPDVALFGEKDWQQLTVIRQMVADLNLALRIVGIPTVREPSGLAMSSRNAYLSDDEKQRAAALHRCLLASASMLEAGVRDYAAIEAAQAETLRGEGFRVDYFAVRRLDDLAEPTPSDCNWVVLVAAWLGRARLIDNISLSL
ncbi:MAG: pantoate--beta-alanine ligase [Proteobacteria bacterium]|nr:pantoate--beta-alanine ligase [Pseudomonadota bacterium]